MDAAIKYLRDKEWSMGHGQCDDCCGLSPNKYWHLTCGDKQGHKLHCEFAKVLIDMGEKVFFIGDELDPEVQKKYDVLQKIDDEHWDNLMKGVRNGSS
tara:strand:- start:2353 stop:2646 length:294 start_codon:yes stop_codon:yes gene_type:complete